MTTLVSAVPIMPGRDLERTSAWYRDRLGFRVRHLEGEYAIVERDGVELHFWGPSGIPPAKSTTMCRVGVLGIRSLYEACDEAGIVHPDAPLERKPWGADEFAVVDCDGNLVTFFERRKVAAALEVVADPRDAD